MPLLKVGYAETQPQKLKVFWRCMNGRSSFKFLTQWRKKCFLCHEVLLPKCTSMMKGLEKKNGVEPMEQRIESFYPHKENRLCTATTKNIKSKFQKKLLLLCIKEKIIICTNSHAAVAALAASGTKSLLVAVCIEKLTVLSEVNQVTTMVVPGHKRIQQNETADRLAREGARTRPIGPEPFSYRYPSAGLYPK